LFRVSESPSFDDDISEVTLDEADGWLEPQPDHLLGGRVFIGVVTERKTELS